MVKKSSKQIIDTSRPMPDKRVCIICSKKCSLKKGDVFITIGEVNGKKLTKIRTICAGCSGTLAQKTIGIVKTYPQLAPKFGFGVQQKKKEGGLILPDYLKNKSN